MRPARRPASRSACWSRRPWCPGRSPRRSPTAARSTRASSPASSTGLHYLFTVGTQDAIQAAAAELVAAGSGRRLGADVARRQRRLTLLADLAAIPLGFAVQKALPDRPGEAMLRGLARQVGWRFTVTGVGGSLLIGVRGSAAGTRQPAGRAPEVRRRTRRRARRASPSRTCWNGGGARMTTMRGPRPTSMRWRQRDRSASRAAWSVAWRSRRTASTGSRPRPAGGCPRYCRAARSCGS